MSLPDAKVIELYSQGKSCADIAYLDECSETSIYNRLKSLGVKIRSRSEANQTFPNSVFISLYNIGLSASQTARLLGINASTVTKRLRLIQFPLRSRRVANKIRYTEDEFQKHFMTKDFVDGLMELVSG
jgi:DNA-binding CsgD family transcriptional regulator